jgi:glucosamine 6-phosphate synthetase-like amidotransferase/phosphosugar isomerase protein
MMASMDPFAFRTDIEAVPTSLERCAAAIADGSLRWPVDEPPRRLLLTGMGSSYFAADVCARRLRVKGVDAVAELASAAATWPAAPDLTVIAISASGSSAETLAALAPHRGRSRVIALTNRPGSAITELADAGVEMLAGDEVGGVACRSFRHTIAALAALESQWFGVDIVSSVRRAADASAALLADVDGWLPPVLDALDGPDGLWLLAPAERLSSALQGALMVREGPRRRADGCETGDWSHVDVYLTKTFDYRAVVFTGSRYETEAARWMTERGSTLVAVGGSAPAARCEVRYDGEQDRTVALLTEPLVAELVAATWWTDQPPSV